MNGIIKGKTNNLIFNILNCHIESIIRWTKYLYPKSNKEDSSSRQSRFRM